MSQWRRVAVFVPEAMGAFWTKRKSDEPSDRSHSPHERGIVEPRVHGDEVLSAVARRNPEEMGPYSCVRGAHKRRIERRRAAGITVAEV